MKRILGMNVRHYRAKRNCSQQVLADESGIFRTYLSRIEAGKSDPSLAVLAALASALDVPAHVLFMPLEE